MGDVTDYLAGLTGENRAALPTTETVAKDYLRLLGPEGRSLGAQPLTIVT